MNDFPNIDIERYITEQMNASEIKKFELRLNIDTDLKANYNRTLAAHTLIKEAGRLELKDMLNTFDSEIKKPKMIPLWVKRSLPIAAILILFFGIFQFGLFNKSLNSSQVFQTNFVAYLAPSELRETSVNLEPNWETAVTMYRKKQYEEAIAQLEIVETTVPQYLVSFYLGTSALAQVTPNMDLALQHFEFVLQGDNDYQQQAKWYKGLTLLKMKKKEEALAIFKDIVESKTFNYKKAEEILNTTFKD